MLYGRDAERSAMTALLDAARDSRSGVLVLRGQAGAGKSALLQDAVAQASDMQVLEARGIESEAELAFAGLHQLLRPALGQLEGLPPPQATALRAAFGLEQGRGDDRFLVSVAVLSMLAEAAERQPVLGVVDDAHWLDEASTNALVFVARRLEAEGVVLLFAARDGDPRRFDAAGLPELEVGGLDRVAVAALLAARAPVSVAPEVRDRLVEETGGNPLALIELPSVLTSGQLSGKEPLPLRLPLTDGVERAFLEPVRRLPTDTQAFLLVAAAEDTGRQATVTAAAAALGAGAAALDAAEAGGLVRVRAGELDFRHPLVRSAVYQGATTSQRREAHRALAEVLGREGDADRRAWHLAASAVEPDERVVRELDAAAERARGRGGFEAACAALERAAALSADPAARGRRLVAAAENAWLAGQLSRTAGLLQAARPLASEPLLRADVGRLRGWYEISVGSVAVAQRILIQAALDVAPVDPGQARRILAGGAEAAWLESDQDAGAELGRVAARLGPAHDSYDRYFADLIAGFLRYLDGDPAAAVRLLTGTIELARRLEDPDLLSLAAHHAFYVGDDAAAYQLNVRVAAAARAGGKVAELLFALPRLAQAELLTGRWTAAAASAAEAVRLASGTGQRALSALPLAWLTLLAALQGDEDGFWSRVGETEQVAAAHSLGVFQGAVNDVVGWARAVQKAATARPASAGTLLGDLSHPVVVTMAALDGVEAAVHAGRRNSALEWLGALEASATHTAAPWAQARTAHARGLLSDGHVAEGRFEEALDHHQRARRPFERARVELAYGELLRRARRRVDARAHLQAALDTFEGLGAAPWAERARLELRASGQATRRRDPSTLRQLTPQELQVARFVARGLPTREVAAQLFLSPRTVDFHLRNVFAKLGISSRTQLAQFRLD
ncbi:MAG TPA: AAA family ATPase [Actinomycetes bacterium]|nr:AAA family ATPase [Actinomycetes bacterium]